MATTPAKKAAAKKTTTSAKENKVSPIKRSTRTVLSLEVDGVEYSGDVEIDEKALSELDEIAGEWDEVQQKYAELTTKLLAKLEEIGLEAEKPKRPGSDAKKIRRWATRVGVEVNAQGAIPNEVRDQYNSAKTKGELKADEQ